jgi:hypothetical protein
MAGGTDGELITYDASGDPANVAVGTSGHVLTSGGAGVAPTFQAAAGGGGKVLQVVSATKTDTWTNSGTFADITGLSVSITPALTSSKILVFVNLHIGGNQGANMYFKVLRDSADISVGDTAGSRTRVSGAAVSPWINGMTSNNVTHVDSPSTTSAITYKVQATGEVGSYTFYLNRYSSDSDSSSRARAASNITVMEIGA